MRTDRTRAIECTESSEPLRGTSVRHHERVVAMRMQASLSDVSLEERGYDARA